VLRQNKANFSDFVEPFGAKVAFETGRTRVERQDLDPEDLSEERILNTSDRVLLALCNGPRFSEDFYSQSVWGVEITTVKNSISKLRGKGLVKDTGKVENRSREIELTEAGRKYVDEYLANETYSNLHHSHNPLRDCDHDEDSTGEVASEAYPDPMQKPLGQDEWADI
jgi:DNA-binding PadR family transcriptional regulator